MGKSVNITLNSFSCQSGDAQQATYYFNWSSVLDVKKKYRMHFTYLGGGNVFDGTSNKLPMVYISFNGESYLTNNTGAMNSQFVGFLKPIVLVGTNKTCYFQAEDNTNVPLYLPSPPQSNQFQVTIRDATGALYLDNAGTPAKPANYIMTLRFVEEEEDED